MGTLTDPLRRTALPTFHQLVVFQAVARTGSGRAAAAALCLDETTVSIHIKRLEKICGQALFARVRRGVIPTESGRAVLAAAENMLTCFQRMGLIGELPTLRQTEESLAPEHLTVGGLRAASAFFELAYAAFHERYPAAKVTMTSVESNDELQIGMLTGEFELGITVRPIASILLASRLLLREPVILIAAPSHPIALGPSLGPAGLEANRFIAWSRAMNGQREIDRALASEGLRLQPAREVNTLGQLKRVVMRGEAIAFVHKSAVLAELRAGQLVEVPVTGIALNRDVYVIQAAKANRSAIASHFVECGQRLAHVLTGTQTATTPTVSPTGPS